MESSCLFSWELEHDMTGIPPKGWIEFESILYFNQCDLCMVEWCGLQFHKVLFLACLPTLSVIINTTPQKEFSVQNKTGSLLTSFLLCTWVLVIHKIHTRYTCNNIHELFRSPVVLNAAKTQQGSPSMRSPDTWLSANNKNILLYPGISWIPHFSNGPKLTGNGNWKDKAKHLSLSYCSNHPT